MKELSPINIYTILHPNINSHILHIHVRHTNWFMGHKASLKKCKGYENKACCLIIVEVKNIYIFLITILKLLSKFLQSYEKIKKFITFPSFLALSTR